MERTAEAAKALVEILMQETDQIKELVLPALGDVLKQVRDVRMAISGEATQILNSFGTLKKTAEYSVELERLTKAIQGLQKAIADTPPEMQARLHDLFRD